MSDESDISDFLASESSDDEFELFLNTPTVKNVNKFLNLFTTPTYYDFEKGEEDDEADNFFNYYRESDAIRRSLSHGNLFESRNEIETFEQSSPVENCTSSNKVSGENIQNEKVHNNSHHKKVTVIHTPELAIEYKIRPTYVLSQQMQTQLVLEEMKKDQENEQPLKEKVLKTTTTQEQLDGKITKPESSNLTKIKQNALSKSLGNIPKCIAKSSPKETTKQTTKKETEVSSIEKPKSRTHMDFCKIFQERYEWAKKRKAEKLKRMLDEEKKMREFHAKPLPKFIKHKLSSESLISSNSNDENQLNATNVQFKARPPTVLYKKPFIPKKADRPITEIHEFNLYSDSRAREREIFDKKQKEKQDHFEMLKQQKLKEQEKRLEEERRRLREEATFKANAIKKFKEFQLKPSDQSLTSPHSPLFSSRIKRFNV